MNKITNEMLTVKEGRVECLDQFIYRSFVNSPAYSSLVTNDLLYQSNLSKDEIDDLIRKEHVEFHNDFFYGETRKELIEITERIMQLMARYSVLRSNSVNIPETEMRKLYDDILNITN